MTPFIKTIRWELVKIFSKWRTYIGFGTILILVPLIMVLVRKYGIDIENEALRSFQGAFDYIGSVTNGLLVSYFLMNVLWIHFPFFIVLVAGDIVASEGASGTFRILLTRPLSRFEVITGKFIATYVYTLAIVLFLGLVSVGLGIAIVGGGDLLVFNKGILIFSQGEALPRFLIAYLVASVMQMTVGALAFLFSTWTSNAVGPIIGTYAVIVVSYILSVLQIDALQAIRPYLFVTYFNVFFVPFNVPVPWRMIAVQLGKLGIFILIFYALSVVSFIRKDIKT